MFKWLLESSLANRLLVIVTSVALMGYGLWTLSTTPVDVFPDLNKPTVTLMTEAGGMASEEVEQLITFPLETSMNGLPGVEIVRSVSSAGLSIVYVTFDWSTEIFRARQMVAERLTALESTLPAGVTPKMGPISSIMGEIMLIAIPYDQHAGLGSTAASGVSGGMAVREYADWVLRPRLGGRRRASPRWRRGRDRLRPHPRDEATAGIAAVLPVRAGGRRTPRRLP